MDEGFEKWGERVSEAGYDGDAERLWEAMIAARDSSGFGLPPDRLIADSAKLGVFCAAVRDGLNDTIPTDAILVALRTMRRRCTLCPDETWVWCAKCGGCGQCCCDDFHCVAHGLPFGACLECDQKDFRDHQGNPPGDD